jgi:hypothetical protein
MTKRVFSQIYEDECINYPPNKKRKLNNFNLDNSLDEDEDEDYTPSDNDSEDIIIKNKNKKNKKNKKKLTLEDILEQKYKDYLNENRKIINKLIQKMNGFYDSLLYLKDNFTNNKTEENLQKLINFINVCNDEHNIVPDIIKILNMDIDSDKKKEIIRLVSQNNDNNAKFKLWFDTLLKIPFNKYIQPYPKSIEDIKNNMKFFPNFYNTLENAIFGQKRLKENLMEIVGKWIINGSNKGHCICILGEPGLGKTSIVKNGLSKALNMPFVNISLAGINDTGYISGFSYTYEGAMQGRLTSGLIESKCMNPIFFMDELDKIDGSNSNGRTIINKLIEITDFTQNDSFEDKYFSGIKLDLSR